MSKRLAAILLASTMTSAAPALADETNGTPGSMVLPQAATRGADGAATAATALPTPRKAIEESVDLKVRSAAETAIRNSARIDKVDRVNKLNGVLAYVLTSPCLRVTTYRVALSDSVVSEDEAVALAKVTKAGSDVAAALVGATQEDARRRLATLGDVSTALPLIAINASDDERDTLVLSADTRAYVKTIDGIPGEGSVGNVGYVRTGDHIRFHATSSKDGYRIEYQAASRHLNQIDHFFSGGASLDIPNVSNAEAKGELDLAAIGAKPVDTGALDTAAKPVSYVEASTRPKGVTAVMIPDTADTSGRAILVYVVSHAD